MGDNLEKAAKDMAASLAKRKELHKDAQEKARDLKK